MIKNKSKSISVKFKLFHLVLLLQKVLLAGIVSQSIFMLKTRLMYVVCFNVNERLRLKIFLQK